MSLPRLLVVGATGYTGRAVVNLARSKDFAVLAHLRPGSASGQILRPEFEAAGAKVAECAFEDEALQQMISDFKPQACVAALGTTRKRGQASGGQDSYESVDKGLTLRVLSALEEAVPACRFVYLSAIGVKLGQTRGYYGARSQVEAALRRSALPWVSVRPSFISGDDRREHRTLERASAKVGDFGLGLMRALGAQGLHDRYASLDARGLARALLAAATEDSLLGTALQGSELRRRAAGTP